MGVLLGALMCALVLSTNPTPNGFSDARQTGAGLPAPPSPASAPSSSSGAATDPGDSTFGAPPSGPTTGNSPSDPPTGPTSPTPTEPGPSPTPAPTGTPSSSGPSTDGPGALATPTPFATDGPTPGRKASRSAAGVPPKEVAPSDTPLIGGGEVRPGTAGAPAPEPAPQPNQAQPPSGGGWSLLNTPGLGPRLVAAGLIGLIVSVAGLITVSLRRRRW
jgi:hypothetical protein